MSDCEYIGVISEESRSRGYVRFDESRVGETFLMTCRW